MASILFNKSLVISSKENANSPISSLRFIKFFTSMLFVFLTLSAAFTNLLIGNVILFEKIKPKKSVKIITKMKIFKNEYCNSLISFCMTLPSIDNIIAPL